jgi:Flp pilus assembly protein protease CpaA
MLDVLYILLLIGIIIATIRDVQTREVPDLVSYGLITLGILGGLILAIIGQDIHIFLEHLYGFLIGLSIGLIMFYARQWGGGDAKLLAGVGGILGFSLSNLSLVEFFVLLVFGGALYGVVTILYLALIKHRKIFLPAFKKHLRTPMVHRLRIALVCSGALIIALIFFVPTDVRILLGFILLALYVLIYSWIFMRIVEQRLLIKEYLVMRLTEGDWVVQDVKVKGRLIVSSTTTGITLEQIAKLRAAKIKKVLVKEGIPFVPGFLIALLVLILAHYLYGAGGLLSFF